MGSPKALLDLGGEPLICRIIHLVHQFDPLASVVVVTGHDAETIRNTVLPDRQITFAHNAAHATGEMISSVKTGVCAVHDSWDGFFLLLLDQPAIRRETLSAMADAWQKHHPAMVIPVYNQKRGHPLFFASRCTAGIISLPPHATLRDFVSQCQPDTQLVDVDDPGVLSDVDTPEDYQRLQQLWKSSRRNADSLTNAPEPKA